jgi:branched-chain amino acid aminotransferase
MVRKGVLYTPHADACLHGITRGLVMEVAESTGIKVIEKNLSLTEFYTADEVFCTGTMGELTPVVLIDGRTIQNKTDTDMLPQLTKEFMELIPRYGAALPF